MAQIKRDYREANRCVDILAKNSLSLALGFSFFNAVLSCLLFQLNADSVGVKYPRLISIS